MNASRQQSADGTHVLLIEDDPVYMEIVRVYLLHQGPKGILLQMVDRLDAGLEVLAGGVVDVVLLDLTLPDSMGYDTFGRVQEACPAVPIIVLTGFDDDRLAHKAMSSGAQDYLVKSELTPSLLARSISYALERGRAVTERQLAAARLAESERRYRAIVEDQTELVCRFLPDGELTFVNRAFRQFFEVDAAHLLGQNFFGLFPENDRVQLATGFAALDRGRPIRSREQRFERPDGEVRWLQWTDRALFDGDKLSEFQSVGRDTTERRHLEEQLRHSQKMEVVGQLVGGIAHDFNNVLTAIMGYSDLLAQRQQAQGRRLGSEIVGLRKAVQRATTLTGRLLAFSRRQLVQPEVLDLNLLVEGIEAMLQPLLGEQIEVVLALATAPLRTKADPGQLEQVIVNLAVNARDAMPLGGRLLVETRSVDLPFERGRELGIEPGLWVLLRVSDTGCGMDAATRQRIFEPFFTTKAGGRGTGLGLATVARMVDASGGHIDVTTAEGAGTTFDIYLPVTAEHPSMAESSGIFVLGEEPHGVERVLLVEDDEPVRSVLTTILTRHDYRVHSVRSAEEALAALSAPDETFDVLVTDIGLTGVDGVELAARARRRHPGLRALFISGYTEDIASSEKVRAAGIPLLQKPFSSKRLLQELREILA